MLALVGLEGWYRELALSGMRASSIFLDVGTSISKSGSCILSLSRALAG